MKWLAPLRKLFKEQPINLRHGRLGENAARGHLERLGMKFLAANFSSKRGEIDLIFRDRDCLVFVEVKASSSEEWERPAARVRREKEEKLTAAALDYLKLLKEPRVKMRFDIVEVILSAGNVAEIRHLPSAFKMRGRSIYTEGANMAPPSRFR